ncbi:MAG: hypothetical protein Ct9H300mP12_01120 [Acidimicrobiales bacterium]|nr:MAG: hypothetical protein Ct9H300mP12_01120 [Acidimicrobiales bacterium]
MGVPRAQVTFVATPGGRIAEAVSEALAAAPSGLVTRVGSVKAPVVAAVGDDRFIGGPPMAGSEQEGARTEPRPTCSWAPSGY